MLCCLLAFTTQTSFGVSNSNSKFIRHFNNLIAAEAGSFRKCYNNAIKSHSLIKGSVDFQFSILPSGRIDHIGVIENLNQENRNMIRCIYQSIIKIRLPRTGKKYSLKINKRINFK